MGTSAEVRHGRLFPRSSACSDCFSAQQNWRSEPPFLSSFAGRSLEKEFMWSCCSWTATSSSDSGGLLLLSRCFPRALTGAISLCSGVGGCFPVNTEACGSYPDSQHQRANTSHILVLSVWWEGSLEAMNCSVTTATFCTVPEVVASFPAWCHWTSFAAGVFGAEIWQCCTAGVWLHVWLFCSPSE